MLLCCICFISKGKDCRSQSRKSKSEVIESDPHAESQSDQKVKVHGSSQSDQKFKINQKQSKSTAVVKVNSSSQSQHQ